MSTVKLEMTLPEDVYLTLQSVGFNKERLNERLKQELAMKLYADQSLSLGKASRMAGMSRADFMELLLRNGLAVIEYTEEDYEKDTATIRRLLEKEVGE
ncbi:MAG: UPF0175 family protein [Anaerolineae bacterium]